MRLSVDNLEEFQLTTITESHGEDIAALAEQIATLSQQLYIYSPNREDVYDLLRAYVEPQKEEILSCLQQYGTLDFS